jgi:putative GTP pyrophosphokinase
MLHIEEILRTNFDVLGVDDKLSDGGPLGYQSTHYLCKLPPRYKGPRYDNTAGVKFEIQVRTLCMHAWAAVSHHLDYKGDWDVPEDLKRALSALGGLFYVADNEFQQFYSARQKSKTEAEQQTRPEKRQELNLDTILPYLSLRFPERRKPSSASASKLVRELKGYGYETIADLENVLDRGADAFREYERRHPPTGGRFVTEGVVRVTDRIVHDRKSVLPTHSDVLHLVKPE